MDGKEVQDPVKWGQEARHQVPEQIPFHSLSFKTASAADLAAQVLVSA